MQVRSIEEWLTEVETQMRDALRGLISASAEDYSAAERKAWIFEWP